MLKSHPNSGRTQDASTKLSTHTYTHTCATHSSHEPPQLIIDLCELEGTLVACVYKQSVPHILHTYPSHTADQ